MPTIGRAEAEAHWTVTRGDAWLAEYRDSATAEYRKPLADALARLDPLSLLDVGCNCGTIVPLVPNAMITGVDINSMAIAAAQRAYPQHEWICASAVEWLPARSHKLVGFDVVVSSSTLAHIAPADIESVIDAIAYMATRAIVLQETCVTPQLDEGQTDCGVLEWRHDYARILRPMGWERVSRVWQNVTTQRPAAVMVFEPRD